LSTPEVGKDAACAKLEELKFVNQEGLKKYRVLECSIADALLRGRSYRKAEAIYRKLREFSENFPKRTSNQRCFRYYVGLAMALHLDHRRDEALTYWIEVRHKISTWGWGKGFAEMVCLYAISDIYFMQERRSEGKQYLSYANELFVKIGREFWVTNLGTVFLDFLRDSIRSTKNHVVID
jgi:hypothetical protein